MAVVHKRVRFRIYELNVVLFPSLKRQLRMISLSDPELNPDEFSSVSLLAANQFLDGFHC